jgi:hypothetical protein
MYAGFADTELARSNIAIKYRWNNSDFRVAGLAQIGGFNQGNGSTQMWQGQLGGDIHNLYGGTLSLDVVGSYALDGVLTSLFTTPIPKFYSANDLKATLSNNTGFLALTKYTWGPAQLFAGWEYFRQGNRSDGFPNGFKTIANYSVSGNILDNKAFPTVWVTTNAFNIPRVYNTLGGLQICGQRPARCDGSVLLRLAKRLFYDAVRRQGIHISSASCAGTLDTLSLLVDYRPVKRIDIYGGVALSNVYAGLANGFQQTQNIDPTVGVRIKF